MYDPDVSFPLLGAVPPRAPKIRNFAPLESHFTANIFTTVSRSITCQLGLNVSSMALTENVWQGLVT